MDALQPPKFALQCLLVHIMRDTESLVEIAGLTDLIVSLVDGVEQVGQNDEDMSSFAVSNVAWGAWGWFGVACADEDGVQDLLEIAARNLSF